MADTHTFIWLRWEPNISVSPEQIGSILNSLQFVCYSICVALIYFIYVYMYVRTNKAQGILGKHPTMMTDQIINPLCQSDPSFIIPLTFVVKFVLSTPFAVQKS